MLQLSDLQLSFGFFMSGNNISFSNSKPDTNDKTQHSMLCLDLWQETWIKLVAGMWQAAPDG